MLPAREAVVRLAPDVSRLGEARRFIGRTLREWHADGARIEAVQLVATELLANAIVHAGSAPVLTLGADGRDLVLRVADESPEPPVVQERTLDAVGGRGLLLVEALGDRWGVDASPPGKVVWVAFDGTLS